MSKDAPAFPAPALTAAAVARDARIGVIAARFNEAIVYQLLSGCLKRLKELGIDDGRLELHRVPGAFELPAAAKMLIAAKRVDAVICLGCVIRGETPHFELVAGEAARGIQNVAVETGVPVIFGVLATDSEQQALERIVSGARAAEAAVEMIALRKTLGARESSGGSFNP